MARSKKTAAPSWKCPRCRRSFARKDQWHSCGARNLDEHFRGRNPDLRGTFNVLVRRLRKLGPVKVDPVKTSINLTARHHFAAVTVRGTFLRLEFLSDHRIEDPRVVHIERQLVQRLDVVDHRLELVAARIDRARQVRQRRRTGGTLHARRDRGGSGRQWRPMRSRVRAPRRRARTCSCSPWRAPALRPCA